MFVGAPQLVQHLVDFHAKKVALEGNLPCFALHLERIFQICSLKSLTRLFKRRRKERYTLSDAMYLDSRLRKFTSRCI